MRRRRLLLTWLAVVAVTACVTVVQAAPSTAAPVRIMPLGDSITAGTGCWRAMLWNRLQATGYTNIDFVGGVSDGGGCNPGYPYDWDHEGHGGYSATGIADQNLLPGWLASARPDVVLVHLGTNDMWGGWIPLQNKLTAFTKLVGQMRASNPNMKIVVAQIIPMSASACATCPADVKAFNDALPGWVAGLTTAQSPIVLADLWTGFDPAIDTNDGVHPNTAGYQKMADRWYPVVTRVLDGVIPTITTTTTTRPATTTTRTTTTTRPATTTTRTTTTTRPATTTTRTSTTTRTTTRSTTTSTTTRSTTTTTTRSTTTTTTRPSSTTSSTTSTPTGTCAVAITISNSWPGGFVADARVTAVSSVRAWQVTLTLPSGAAITNLWNGTSTGSTGTVTVLNAAWNGTLAPGTSASFGFQGTGSLNGVAAGCAAA